MPYNTQDTANIDNSVNHHGKLLYKYRKENIELTRILMASSILNIILIASLSFQRLELNKINHVDHPKPLLPISEVRGL